MWVVAPLGDVRGGVVRDAGCFGRGFVPMVCGVAGRSDVGQGRGGPRSRKGVGVVKSVWDCSGRTIALTGMRFYPYVSSVSSFMFGLVVVFS